jgi:tyrosinase
MQKQQPNQFTLLILALQQFEAQANTQATSYYQISGIHGVPRQNYNNVGQCSTCSGADGYCTHDSVLFPAWHRAYIALFEQEFLSVVNSIANSWPTSGAATTKAQMQQAASTMRWPYWDWAAAPPNGGNNFPNMVSAPTISVSGPTGQETIKNPFFKYTFNDPSNMHYSPFTIWKNTLRYPTSDTASATSQEASCVSAFNNIRASLQDQLYQLFSTCKDYLHFSNDHAGSSSTSCSNSLEGIHNTVHTTTGGVPSTSVKTAGHMYYLSTAAFDPVFWLHHTNVDRIFAMWQTINPNSYGASQTAPHNTWTIAQGTTQNADSPLTPFYKDSGSTFWTTNGVQNWANTFHYTYPEFADSDGSSAAIQSYVKKLYGPSATATAGSSKRTAMPDPAIQGGPLGGVIPTGAPPIPKGFGSALPGLVASNGSTYQYVANIKAPRYALGGSYYVFVFMGPPASEDPSTWIFDQNLIGPMGVLSQDGMQSKDVLTTASIPLTRALTGKFDSGVLGDLSQMIVAPFLENLLEWRILGPDGTSVNPDNVPGFELSVYASTSTPGDESCLPQWSDFIPLLGVTKGKNGGLQGLAGILGGL